MAAETGAVRHRIVGVCPAAQAWVLAGLVRDHAAPVWLVVAADLKAAEQLAEDATFFCASGGGRAQEVLLFPESLVDHPDLREAFAASSDRLLVLSRLRAVRSIGGTGTAGPGLVVVTTPAALLQAVPALEALDTHELVLERGARHPFQQVLTRLSELDYDSEPVCEAPGHYAVRGGIIDVYPVTAARPYRLDFFGDELEDIRELDPVSQRSGARLDRLAIAASPRLRLESARTGLADYLAPRTRLAFIEPATLEEEFSAFARERGDGLAPLLARCAEAYGLGDLDEASALFAQPASEIVWDTESLAHNRAAPSEALLAHERLAAEEAGRQTFVEQLGAWQQEGFALTFVAAKPGEEQRLREILAADPVGRTLQPTFLLGPLNEGFRVTFRGEPSIAPTVPAPGPAMTGSGGKEGTPRRKRSAAGHRGLVVVTETEMFGRKRTRRPGAAGRAVAVRAQIDQLLDFSELVEGDFVVHLQHGIALFRGLTKLETAQGEREVISLEFDDGVTLHVPLQESHLISRYVGLGRTRPQLGRIGSGRWDKTRRAAERATVDLAAEMLRLQALRESQPGLAFPADTPWQREFEASFPFTETPGQARAIEETKGDMERARPMDRLICGEVGFGKTEVAVRAAFKAVQAGKQVIILVPTTVLAQQHLNTFRERMAGYPVSVEMISRFRSKAEQREILAAAATGRIDILVGTHRLLQRDVTLKDLGLVIVDEEQRFGVKHKEVFKRMRASVDVLSMSATPVPRTLYLALTGARDLSVIDTPPVNRHPIQTIVKTYDEQVVVDAVRHEIRRGGQVFYLHNRVASIEQVAGRLRELLPDLAVGVGHGQMDAATLERIMTEFVAGRYQVLVCTTIIESGLDIPNCNTLIIEGADRFGLSQLYQLRGRVGRFKHQAYAYLLLHRHARLLDAARQRLAAMRQHAQLGAGFRIAMRDLELRGAGNLLGTEQSGHIVGVGFELYCQLLRQSVARLRGERTAAAIRASVKLDFVFVGEGAASGDTAPGRHTDGYTAIKDAEDAAGGPAPARIQARIPVAYIGETRLRIDAYRRLALADSVAALHQLEAEFKDRFGAPGREVRTLFSVTEIRIRAEQKGIVSVETESNRLKCLRGSGRHDDWVMLGSRFPRLTAPTPGLRLQEIIVFLNNLPNP
jgi:transcription-repair coupling factor (superfamily II helicase)